MLTSIPFDLSRFPALRHINIEQHIFYFPNFLHFLTCLLSIPSSPSGIEVLETRIIWSDVENGHEKDFLSSDTWSTLDELFTSQRFVSLRKVVLWLELHMALRVRPPPILELERNLNVKDLFPLFRASNTQRTLEVHLKVLPFVHRPPISLLIMAVRRGYWGRDAEKAESPKKTRVRIYGCWVHSLNDSFYATREFILIGLYTPGNL